MPCSTLTLIFLLLARGAKVESAWGSGDRFSPGASMAIDACATLVGAALGSPYPTGIYIGQPAFKAMGACSPRDPRPFPCPPSSCHFCRRRRRYLYTHLVVFYCWGFFLQTR